ncbi:MAG TPA: non-heme iron oxygenase ferredoxin subunit [Burkholderiaceae bacterium]|nr:non-heme iron oxygenase ferredoxin subunit [Burkholderiaceae bacterium]
MAAGRCLVGVLQDYPPGEIRMAMLDDGTLVAIYNVDGRLYATADQCTHGEASLSDEGRLTGCVVECPWHNGTFDVTTGAALTLPCSVALKTYPVIVAGEDVYVELGT